MNRRVIRVAELIKREMGKIMIEDFKNQEIGFVTITDVDLTPDLKLAKIFFSVYGPPEKQKQTQKILEDATPFFRKEISHRIQLRFAPVLRFYYDETQEKAGHVFEILEKIKKEEKNKCSGK